jgi:uncharacterized protein (DUF1778 family)
VTESSDVFQNKRDGVLCTGAARTALRICCSAAEAKIIRSQAKSEMRTLSAYVLGVVWRALQFDKGFERLAMRARPKPRRMGPRTSILVRCSVAEASRIRLAAARRRTETSTFVLEQLRRAWRVRGLVAQK